ncbi:hypothetical protein ALC62_10501 [Cyphomyrmex costatus]|uniref:Myb-like domain-containing protein n=1 Tax=Cyphomyrmex costatus TaxID=456900 RepID=A0A151IDH6_9HYME|nr:hypothetical protein ALC62_10501 [Cyphomyrmex costatus]
MLNKESLLQAGYIFPDNSDFETSGTLYSSSFENVELDATKSNVDEWSDESTRLLLDKYAEYLELVGPMKQFKNKKLMWLKISQDLEKSLRIQKTPIQCENRFKTILRRKRVCEKNNSTSASGSKRVKINFENEIKNIAAKDDSVEPEVLQSSSNIILNVKDSNLSKVSNSKKDKTKRGILETLIEIHKE